MPNKGGVAGYVDRIWRRYHSKWGMQMTGMIFQTRSNTTEDNVGKTAVSQRTGDTAFAV